MKNILLVEDDKFLSALLKNRLEKEGFVVVCATNGEEAINILRSEQKPDLVLLDIILPKKNGFEVLEEIRQSPEMTRLPIIIISNLGQDADVERGKNFGIVEYYIKAQMSIDDLVSRVGAFINTV